MSAFENAITVILKHEGGFVDNPNDPGGATNWGISLNFLVDHPKDGDFDHDGDVDREDILNMNRDDAIDIYKKFWWDKFNYGLIVDQTIATKVFDFSVNMGAKRSHMLLQQALNTAFDLGLTVDGILGKASMSVINSCTDGDREQQLLNAYCDEAWTFYQNLIIKNPKLQVFAKGWKNRAYSIKSANAFG